MRATTASPSAVRTVAASTDDTRRPDARHARSPDGSHSPQERQRATGLRQQGATGLPRRVVRGLALAGVLALAACGPQRQPGVVGYVEGFSGAIVTDEPRAALVARDVLSAGGTAADAAVALSLALTVTLPSSAGLGGGGVCLVVDRDAENDLRVEALDFLPNAPAGPPGPEGAVAVPAMPRGLYALHARAGVLRWESLVIPAETLARAGFPASRALASEVQAVGGAPPGMLRGGGASLGEGQRLQNLDLARALGQVRVGPGEFHAGAIAREMTAAAGQQGHTLTAEAVRDWRPVWRPVLRRDYGSHIDAFAPVPDSAAGLADAWAAMDDPDDRPDGPGGALAPLPDLSESQRGRGATAFAVADSYGGAVTCALTLNRPFGTGQPLAGLGFPLVPLPDARSPDLALMTRVNANSKVILGAVAAAGGAARDAALQAGLPALKGDVGAREAVADVRAGGLGRALVNVIDCPDGLPRAPESCSVAVDPRGAGLALRVGD
ncbi:gamma-glutamyltransferase [Roseospira marina]|nr:gamma-glutamyltransferase [Roseospira marina]MBB4315078.1 gamma-glutamyltranspeptidase/glutathione hydrolase [Roseospira marina]MBB5088152.1 gamma-glutamyltranspeptidase/glutathione hydrolase [Roseospira marina]